ncbi:MAG TPA: sensor histidine kinase [Bacillales bacterium]|nr:sensor histidine kinase [Bacillales bacterium]
MIRIRTKLLIFLLVLVVLMNGVAFLLYQNNQHSISQYNRILNRFFLLNEVSQRTTDVYEKLNAYLVEQTSEVYEDYLDARRALKAEQAKLPVIVTEGNYLTVENYSHMITSFLEQCAIVSRAYQTGKLNRYSSHLTNAENISLFIRETTLDLLNNELNNFHGFYRDMSRKSAYFNSMGIFVFISTFLLCTLFAVWFSQGITRPISRLTLAAEEISRGKFDGEPVEVSTKDELRFLTHTFNDMRTNTYEMIEEIKQKSELDQLLKEMELKSLQSQINPHFLFNILNTVSKTAYLEEADRTSELIESTAALLRHNLSSLEKPTTLGKEVEIIREYFFLQTARFGDRVTFKTEINESCLGVEIPNMTLQPVVENSFIHGIESYEEGAEIQLRIERAADGGVIIEVADNGIGMDEETRERLLDPEDESGHEDRRGHSTGLGVKNVIKRLELFYGRQGLVEIASGEGKGTKVTLVIPPRREEGEEDVQVVDRG